MRDTATLRRRSRRQLITWALSSLVIAGVLVVLNVAVLRLANALLLRETGAQLRSLVSLAASQMDGDAIASFDDEGDMEREDFRRAVRRLSRIRMSHPDIRFVYTMRYTGEGMRWRFMVDAEPYDWDEDGDGALTPEERGSKPGDVYEAKASFQAKMLQGLQRPTVDLTPAPDPPFGKIVSGYAPIHNAQGEVVGILGVDMLYATVAMKLETLRAVLMAISALIGLLMIYAVLLYQRQQIATEQAQDLRAQLEEVKAQFAKFVPSKVREELERNPSAASLERHERDVSVMFADIAGYTRMSERMAGAALGGVLERYFSAYLERIYEHGGEVNETAGDGLMVIFSGASHPEEAVRAALAIQAETERLNGEQAEEAPVQINIGVNSGPAFVGLNRFVTHAGERVTYTATGPTTNVAARIAGEARGGDILISEATAERLPSELEVEPAGERRLKNVSSPVQVFRPQAS